QQRPLAEVKNDVRERLVQQRAIALAQAEGKAKLAAWQAAPASAALRPPVVLARNQPQGVPPAVLKAALSAPAGADTAAWTSADLGKDGFVVLRVNHVLARAEPDAAQARQEREQLAQLLARTESQAYLAQLRAHLKAQVLAKKSTDAASDAGK
ncbi:MAG TPA: peptidyl-prolyl cis-trans isomerase, partial [Burkholderiaceae bacterium]|nr:peptidyl-prolyl cis-trans isomerase [Burkholderiaceae bacterium]